MSTTGIVTMLMMLSHRPPFIMFFMDTSPTAKATALDDLPTGQHVGTGDGKRDSYAHDQRIDPKTDANGGHNG